MLDDAPLGAITDYPDQYDPSVLFAVPRAAARDPMGVEGKLPFSGFDQWTAYEVSWLNAKGKPHVAILDIRFPFDSTNIVESKSLKLYLNSFNQSTKFPAIDELINQITIDLGRVSGADVVVNERTMTQEYVGQPTGICLDGLDVKLLLDLSFCCLWNSFIFIDAQNNVLKASFVQ